MSHQNLPADAPQHPTPRTSAGSVRHADPHTQAPFPNQSPSPSPASPVETIEQPSLTTPQLRSVGTTHTVPATVRDADAMTADALAQRHQAITRLGVVPTRATQTSAQRGTATLADPTPSSGGNVHALAIPEQATPAPSNEASTPTLGTRRPGTADLTAVPASPHDNAQPATPGSTPLPTTSADNAPDSTQTQASRAATTTPASSPALTPAPQLKALDAISSPATATAPDNTTSTGSAGNTVALGNTAAVGSPSDASPAATVDTTAERNARAAGPTLPEARAWARQLVQAVSEVLAGDRPISQLVRFTDDAVFNDLNRRVRLLGLTTTATTRGTKERSAVRSIRVYIPVAQVAEVAAHVRHGDRSRAIALRMEVRRNRWICTALELG